VLLWSAEAAVAVLSLRLDCYEVLPNR